MTPEPVTLPDLAAYADLLPPMNAPELSAAMRASDFEALDRFTDWLHAMLAPADVLEQPDSGLTVESVAPEGIYVGGYLYMATAQGEIMPWQSDMLASEWALLQ